MKINDTIILILFSMLVALMIVMPPNSYAAKIDGAPIGCQQLKDEGRKCIEDYRVMFSEEWRGEEAVMPYGELVELTKSIHNRFTYTSDVKNSDGGDGEQWIWNTDGKAFSGDCEDFALTLRYELGKRGYASRLAATTTTGEAIDHAILVHGSYIINNRDPLPVKFYQVDYPIILMSGLSDEEGWDVYPGIFRLPIGVEETEE